MSVADPEIQRVIIGIIIVLSALLVENIFLIPFILLGFHGAATKDERYTN